MIIPNDLPDLYLAPVLLEVEARVDRLSTLAPDDLSVEIALTSDAPDWSRAWREQALATALQHLLDLHGWTLSVDGRGVRLEHRRRTVTIALPPQLEEFLAGPQGAGTETSAQSG
jgi:hypothetical protein